MTDDPADRSVGSTDGTDVEASPDNTLSAVTDSADDPAAPAAAIDVSTVPAVYKVSSVAPLCNTAHEAEVGCTDLSACHSDVLNDGICADISEQTAGF